MFRSIGELDPWARLLLWKQEGRNRQALLPRVPLLETNSVFNWGNLSLEGFQALVPVLNTQALRELQSQAKRFLALKHLRAGTSIWR